MNSYVTHGILSKHITVSSKQNQLMPNLFWRYSNSLFHSKDHYFITTQWKNYPFSFLFSSSPLPAIWTWVSYFVHESFTCKVVHPSFQRIMPLEVTIPRGQHTHRAVSLCLERAMLTHSEERGKHNFTWGEGWRLSLTSISIEVSPKTLQMCNTAVFVFVRIVVGINREKAKQQSHCPWRFSIKG